MNTQTLTWSKEQPSDYTLDESIVLVRRISHDDVYTFFVGILLKNYDGYIIIYSYGDIETIVSPTQVEWALL
jgi:hypothetical protein